MGFVSSQCTVKYSLSVLKYTLTTRYGFVFLCSSPWSINPVSLDSKRTNPSKHIYSISSFKRRVVYLISGVLDEVFIRGRRLVQNSKTSKNTTSRTKQTETEMYKDSL